jgi:phosphatidate cytidylyltransferase
MDDDQPGQKGARRGRNTVTWLADTPPAIFYCLAAIFSLLLVASTTSAILGRVHPDQDYTELRQRIRSWWWIAGIVSLALLLDLTVSLFFLAFVSFLALKEYLSLVPTRRADRRVLFWAYLTIPVQYYWVGIGWYGMFIIFIPVYAFLFIPMRMVMVGVTDGFLRAAGTLQWGLMVTVFSLSHMAYLLALGGRSAPAGGQGLLIYLLVLTQLNDVFQYLWGKLLGRHKVVPTVSPNKTLEGLLGGVLTTIVLAWFLSPLLTPLVGMQRLVAGLLIGLGGFVGDVVLSAVKRDLGVKDSGHSIPGHGGILDRVDSLTYTAPLIFHYLHYLQP